MIEALKYYISCGISCVPCGKEKAPAVKEWKQWQERLPDFVEFGLFKTPKIGIVCGRVSGNLEVIDVDSKYHVKGKAFNSDVLAGLDFDPVVVETISGGVHIYYRTEDVQGNTKISGKKDGKKVLYFIESRGDGGYVIAPPSEGYKIIHGSFDKLPTLTKQQHSDWWDHLRTFNEHFEKPYQPKVSYNSKSFIKSPLTDYNERGDIFPVLKKAGWKEYQTRDKNVLFTRPGKEKGISASYHIEKKLFYVFTSNTIFESNRAYMPYQVLAILDFNGDYSLLSKELVAGGYGVSERKLKSEIRRLINTKLDDGVPNEDIAKQITVNYPNIIESEAKALVEGVATSSQFNFNKFWNIKVNNSGEQKISIIQYEFCKFLNSQLGLSLFFGDNKSSVFRLILDKNGLIEECTSEMLKKRVINFIEDELPEYFDEIHRNVLCETLIKNTTIFKDGFFEFIDHSNFEIMRDKKDSAFFYFNNVIAEVSAKGVREIKYDDTGKVWKTQVNEQNFFKTEDFECNFKDFCFKLSGSDVGKFNLLRSIIGYALHKYKDPTNSKAIILCEELEDSNKGGGSGKSILIKAIGKMIDGMTLDGELFDPKQPFAMQRYKLGQSFIAVEDAAKNMSLKHFKSLITEGLTIDKKNKDQLYLPYKDAPKWFFTTNYNIGGIANYEKRRVIKFGVEPFFNIKNKPDEYYKQYFFDDWDKYEWNKFFNFMIDCVQYYFTNGIKELPSVVLNRKGLINSFGREFTEFISDWQVTRISVKELYDEYLDQSDQSKQDYNFRRFKAALEASIELLELPVVIEKDRLNKNKMMVIPIGYDEPKESKQESLTFIDTSDEEEPF